MEDRLRTNGKRWTRQKMFSLIRFFEEKEYVNDFLNGDLYMNSIGHFWTMGQQNPQDDFLEGTTETLSAEAIKNKYGMELPESFSSNTLIPVMNRVEGYQFVHILCFYLHEYDAALKLATRIPRFIKGLGKYAVKIDDVQAFVNILFKNIYREHLYGLMGPIEYKDLTEEYEYMDCFNKYKTHQDEHEWRFALIPDFEKAKEEAQKLRYENLNKNPAMPVSRYDKSIYFKVGDLRHIAQIVDADLLIQDAGKVYGEDYKTVDELTIPWDERRKYIELLQSKRIPVSYQAYPEQYVGYGPREAFREKVLEIDSGVKPIITIG